MVLFQTIFKEKRIRRQTEQPLKKRSRMKAEKGRRRRKPILQKALQLTEKIRKVCKRKQLLVCKRKQLLVCKRKQLLVCKRKQLLVWKGRCKNGRSEWTLYR